MPLQDYPFIRVISSPLTEEQLTPLDKRCEVIQFCTSLNDKEFIRLAEFHSAYPNVPLRVYGYEPVKDLEFLRYFPFLREFQTDVWTLESLEGLRHLPSDLQFLGLGATKSKARSLRILERFPALKDLFIEGHTKGISALKDCTHLESLTLRSITLPDLSLLMDLSNLKHLRLRLGGTKNLKLLPRIGKLLYLELWRILGLSDVNVIAELSELQFLFLQALNKVTELPSFEKLTALRRVHLEALRGVKNLKPISLAPNLAELVVVDMPQLKVESFSPFVGHQALRAASVGTRSQKKNRAIMDLLNLPSAGYPEKWDFQFVES